MRVQMNPIEVITLADLQGKLRPIRFRIDGEIVKVLYVNQVTEEQWAKQRTFINLCQSVIREQ